MQTLSFVATAMRPPPNRSWGGGIYATASRYAGSLWVDTAPPLCRALGVERVERALRLRELESNLVALEAAAGAERRSSRNSQPAPPSTSSSAATLLPNKKKRQKIKKNAKKGAKNSQPASSSASSSATTNPCKTKQKNGDKASQCGRYLAGTHQDRLSTSY